MNAEKRNILYVLIASAGAGAGLPFLLNSFLAGAAFAIAILAILGTPFLVLEQVEKQIRLRHQLSLRERQAVVFATGYSPFVIGSTLTRASRIDDFTDYFGGGFSLALLGLPILAVLIWLTSRMFDFSVPPEEIGMQSSFEEAEETHTDLDGAGAGDAGSKLV